MKEGATEAITNKVGSDIADAVLCTADGTNYWSIDDYKLHELVMATIQGAADRPNTSNVLDQLTAILSFCFDFQIRSSQTSIPSKPKCPYTLLQHFH